MTAAALVDVDGTLVDSNYHHALTWHEAFRACGLTIPVWRLHRLVGMGGDQLVGAAAGDEAERELGDAVRDRHKALFDEMLSGIAPLPGAHDLLRALKDVGLTVVIATSAAQEHLDAFLDLVDAREVADGWTGKDEVDTSKPAPDLVEAALEQAGTRDAVMIGDSVWDVESARRAGIDTVCLLSGGFGRDELLDAGAVAVYESAADLAANVRELLS